MIKLWATVLFLSFTCVAYSAPTLNFSDITSGPKTGNTDGVGSGAIVTVWGNNLGSTQGASRVYVGDVEATAIYYWKDADGQLPGGPADLKTYHKMQEIAFAVPSGAVDGANTIKVSVGGTDSNTLPFTVRPGNIYFIKSTGNDTTGNGSWNTSWATLQESLQATKIAAGDIVYTVGVGSSVDVNIGNTASMLGTATNMYAIAVYPNTTSSVTGNSAAALRLWSATGPHGFWTFSKFSVTTIHNALPSGRWSRVIGNKITGPQASPLGYSGALAASCESTVGNSDNCGGAKIFGNEIYNYGKTDGTTPISHHLYYITNRSGVPAAAYEIGWNYHHDNPLTHGIHVYDQTPCGGWSDTIRIHDNVVKNQGSNSININMSCTGDTSTFDVFNNLLIKDESYVGTGYGVAGSAIRVDVASTNIVKILNNTVYNFGAPNTLGAGTAEFRNNIVFGLHDREYFNTGTPTVASDNLYYNPNYAKTPPSWGTGAINSDPLFSNASGHDFSLSTGSPALSAGYDTTPVATLDFVGNTRSSTPAIGAFDVVSSTINGACDSSNGQALPSAPTVNLCSAGTPSAVSGTGPWSWTCAGSGGGSAASCGATLLEAPPVGDASALVACPVIAGFR